MYNLSKNAPKGTTSVQGRYRVQTKSQPEKGIAVEVDDPARPLHFVGGRGVEHKRNTRRWAQILAELFPCHLCVG